MTLTLKLALANLVVVFVAFGPGMVGYDYTRPTKWLVQVPACFWLVASAYLMQSEQNRQKTGRP